MKRTVIQLISNNDILEYEINEDTTYQILKI